MPKTIRIDKGSFIPRGLVGVTRPEFEEKFIEPISELSDTVLPIIRNLEVTVVTQSVRDTADGGSVVDVVIELPDTFSAEDVDIRITPMGAI